MAGDSDYFVTVFDASGNMLYSTYLGGSGIEGTPPTNTFAFDSNNGNNVAVDAQGPVYVTGITPSSDFPVTPGNAIQPQIAGGINAFLAKFAGFSSPPIQCVPATTSWGVLLLFLILAGVSIRRIRRAPPARS